MLSLDPNFAYAHYFVGVVFLKKRELDKAKTEFSRALAVLPFVPEAQVGLGLVCYAEGQYGAALKNFQEAAKQSPEGERTYYYPE